MLRFIHSGATLCPLEHRVWAQQNGNEWQTVDVGARAVREKQGFICELYCQSSRHLSQQSL